MDGKLPPLIDEFLSTLSGPVHELAVRVFAFYGESLAQRCGDIAEAFEVRAAAQIKKACESGKAVDVGRLPDSVTKQMLADFGAHSPEEVLRRNVCATFRGAYAQAVATPLAVVAAFAEWLATKQVPIKALSDEDRRLAVVARSHQGSSVFGKATSKLPPRSDPRPVQEAVVLGGAQRGAKRRDRFRIGPASRLAQSLQTDGSNGHTRGTRSSPVVARLARLSETTPLRPSTVNTYVSNSVGFLKWLCIELKLVAPDTAVTLATVETHEKAVFAVLGGDSEAFEEKLRRWKEHLRKSGFSENSVNTTAAGVRKLHACCRLMNAAAVS